MNKIPFSVQFKNSRRDDTETTFTVAAEHISKVAQHVTDTYPSAVCIRIFRINGDNNERI